MSETKFAKGPWQGCIRFSPVGMDSDFNLAWLTAEPGSDRDIEARANARLIRAAPELYEALAELVAQVSDDGNLWLEIESLLKKARFPVAPLKVAVGRANAALARARGDQ